MRFIEPSRQFPRPILWAMPSTLPAWTGLPVGHSTPLVRADRVVPRMLGSIGRKKGLDALPQASRPRTSPNTNQNPLRAVAFLKGTGLFPISMA